MLQMKGRREYYSPKEQIINLHQANDQLREDLEETRFKLDEQLRVNSRINYLLEEATANTFARQGSVLINF